MYVLVNTIKVDLDHLLELGSSATKGMVDLKMSRREVVLQPSISRDMP